MARGIHVTAQTLDDGRSLGGRVHDVTAYSMRFETEHRLEPGTLLELTLARPGQPETVHVQGIVLQHRHGLAADVHVVGPDRASLSALIQAEIA